MTSLTVGADWSTVMSTEASSLLPASSTAVARMRCCPSPGTVTRAVQMFCVLTEALTKDVPTLTSTRHGSVTLPWTSMVVTLKSSPRSGAVIVISGTVASKQTSTDFLAEFPAGSVATKVMGVQPGVTEVR